MFQILRLSQASLSEAKSVNVVKLLSTDASKLDHVSTVFYNNTHTAPETRTRSRLEISVCRRATCSLHIGKRRHSVTELPCCVLLVVSAPRKCRHSAAAVFLRTTGRSDAVGARAPCPDRTPSVPPQPLCRHAQVGVLPYFCFMRRIVTFLFSRCTSKWPSGFFYQN